MAAYPTRRDDPLAEKKRKVDVWSEEEDVWSPDPFAWVYPDSYSAKMEQARRDEESAPKIPTLDHFKPPTRFHIADLFSVRESGSQAVLSAARFLLGVSSSLDGEPLRRCSGFWVDWDEEKKTGLVLTTARLIRTKDAPYSVWSGGQEYAPRADVTVHLLNGTSAKGDLVYYQPHYDIAFLNVEVDQPIKSPSFREKDVNFAQEVFQLGRDNSLNLRITYARAEYLNPNMFERHHNVYFCSLDDHDDDNNEYDNGGLVIDSNGEVAGMVNDPERFGSFIPSSILLNCLDSWKKYRYIARPHLGMRFEAIKLLEPAHVDMLWRMYNIDDGLVVREVSKGSNAEKCGIQKGDLVECIKGECISTTIQLENLLMSICKGPSDSQNGHNADVHISVGVFHTLKKYRRIVQLTANVSDLGEVIARVGEPPWRLTYVYGEPRTEDHHHMWSLHRDLHKQVFHIHMIAVKVEGQTSKSDWTMPWLTTPGGTPSRTPRWNTLWRLARTTVPCHHAQAHDVGAPSGDWQEMSPIRGDV